MAEGGSLRELVVSLFIKKDEHSQKEAEKGIDVLKDKLEQLSEIAKVALEAFLVEKTFEFLEHTAEAAEQLARTATLLGTSTDEFQKLEYAAKAADATTQGLTTGLTFLSRAMDAAKQGSAQQAEAFARLGVHLKNADGTAKGVQDVFYDVADAIKATDDPGKRARLTFELMGRGSAELIPMLMQGSEALHDLGDEAERFGIIQGEDFFRSVEDFSKGLKKIKAIVSALSQRLAQPMFDAFTKVFDKLTHWYTLHANEILPAVTSIGKILGDFFKNLTQLVEPLGVVLANFFMSLHEGDPALRIFAASIGLLMIAFAPMLAAFALIALAVEDFYTYLEGGDSYFGDFIHGLKEFGFQFTDLFSDLWKTAQHFLFEASLDEILGRLGAIFSAWFDFLKSKFDIIIDYIKKDIAAIFGGDKAIIGAILPESVSSLFGGGSSAQSAAANSASNANSVNSNFKADIVVNSPPGASAQDVAGAVTTAIDEWHDSKMREAYESLVSADQ